MKHICTLIKEAKITGPFTIANTGAKSKSNNIWQFKYVTNSNINCLEWFFKSKDDADDYIKTHDEVSGFYAYQMPCKNCECWTLVSDDKELVKAQNRKYCTKKRGGFYHIQYGVVSVTGAENINL